MSKNTISTVTTPKITNEEFAYATAAGEQIAKDLAHIGKISNIIIDDEVKKERVKSVVFAAAAAFINLSEGITITIICDSKDEAKDAITEVREHLGRFHDIDDVLVRIDKEPMILVDTHSVKPVLLRAYYVGIHDVVPTDVVISRLPAERTIEIVGKKPKIMTIKYDTKTSK